LIRYGVIGIVAMVAMVARIGKVHGGVLVVILNFVLLTGEGCSRPLVLGLLAVGDEDGQGQRSG